MSYAAFKNRPKTAIKFNGYNRGLSKKEIPIVHKFEDNFDALEYIFQEIKGELDKKIHSSSSVQTKRLQSASKQKAQKSATLTVDLNDNGEADIVLKYGPTKEKSNKKEQEKSEKLENQVSNYAAIKDIIARLEEKLLNENDETLSNSYKERINNLKGFIELLQFCFKYLGKSGDDIENVKSDFFQCVSKDPIEITILNSKARYTIEDVLTKYFKYISKAVQENSEHEVGYTMKLICITGFY